MRVKIVFCSSKLGVIVKVKVIWLKLVKFIVVVVKLLNSM